MATINAIAHLNQLTKDVDNDYYLNAQVKGTLTLADIVERLKKREIATKNVDGAAFVQTFLDECIAATLEGYHVNTSLFQTSISIQGAILSTDLGHNIDADRLKVSINLTQGEAAREAIAGTIVYAFEQAAATGPVVQSVCDPTENIENHLNHNAMVLIRGLRLAIKGEDPSVGVRFTSVADGSTTVLVPASKIFPNTPTKLQFSLPDEVTDGEWTVSVITQSTGSAKLLATPRFYDYPYIIKVGEVEEEGGEEDLPVIE